ncbi:coiled-coil domain-containing protein [Candidatus Pelagibacter sp. HIMB1495]|uniref:coiled-coil domain-containing protein n=1 Tax=unclassified Candidatus Pelagibacter TaxID=2647897 RepID=UPI003F82CC1C
MKKTPIYIKKTLDEIRLELLKDKKLKLSRQLYVQKLKEIFNEQVIDLKDDIETKMSSTGTDKTVVISSSKDTSLQSKSRQANSNNKIIFLNNEVVEQNLSDIDEANNDLSNFGNLDDSIIELKDEVSNTNDQKIIDLIEEVDDIVNLTKEVAESVTSNQDNDYEKTLNDEVVKEEITTPQTFSNEQLEMLNAKINDLDLNSSELTEKLDELLNQKNIFSEKFNDELDLKLTEALTRSEENLENKLNNINENYHQEFEKYEDEANKNFANLEDQIGQLNTQFDDIQNNISSISNKIDDNINQLNNPQKITENLNIEKQLDEKIKDLKDYNLKIENTLNNLHNKIEETLDNLSTYRNEAAEKIDQINQKIQNLEPEIINQIEEKQKNKSESEKLQEKFDQISKVIDLQNMRMLQMYHSSELQNSHSILQNNMKQRNQDHETKDETLKLIQDQMKEELYPNIQNEIEKQFNLLKDQLSNYEIKSILDKIQSTNISKEAKKPLKKFSNLFDAKKYVKGIVSKKSRDWIKENESSIENVAKKLLNE